MFGYIGQNRIYCQQNQKSWICRRKGCSTGGLGNIIVSETDVVDIYDPELTLEGLRIIYEKNKGLN